MLIIITKSLWRKLHPGNWVSLMLLSNLNNAKISAHTHTHKRIWINWKKKCFYSAATLTAFCFFMPWINFMLSRMELQADLNSCTSCSASLASASSSSAWNSRLSWSCGPKTHFQKLKSFTNIGTNILYFQQTIWSKYLIATFWKYIELLWHLYCTQGWWLSGGKK